MFGPSNNLCLRTLSGKVKFGRNYRGINWVLDSDSHSVAHYLRFRFQRKKSSATFKSLNCHLCEPFPNQLTTRSVRVRLECFTLLGAAYVRLSEIVPQN